MKKLRWGVPLFFVVAMALTSVQPVRYSLMDKTVAQLPEYVSYEEAMGKVLPFEIREKAEVKKCRDFLIPPGQVSGDVSGMPHLLADVQVALGSYGGWRLCVSDSVRNAMVKRADERFRLWGNMGIGREMIAHVKSQKDAAMKTRYSALCSVQTLPGPGYDCRLVLSVNDEVLQTRLFDATVSFMAPETLKALTLSRENAFAKLVDEKRRALQNLMILGGLSVAFLLWLFGWGIRACRKKKRRAAYRVYLMAEIEKREDLVRNGHYVAALELAEDYLEIFPKDTEIKAFRERLMDFTGGDPKKAQLAWVEAKKLAKRLSAAAPMENGRYLLEGEKENIGGLLPYHPGLKAVYDQLQVMDEAAERERLAAADGHFARVEAAFREGDLAEGRFLLDGFLKNHPDYPKAVVMKRALSGSPARSFTLKAGGQSEVKVVVSDHMFVGRGDEDEVPDVVLADRRVSRRHLRITLSHGTLTAEDLGSAGGTYINGDSVVDQASLGVGDLLTLSKVINFNVACIQKNGGGATGAMLEGDDMTLCLVRRKLELGFSGGRVQCGNDRVVIWRDERAVWISSPRSLVFPGEKSAYRVDDTFEIKEAG